jgi:3-deoxy-D-manno-octulosonic-acid transferase
MVRWKNRDQPPPELRILLIDTIGLLAGLYRGADLAYVGAGFTTGVHNTMEPASMGLPVFFGPRYDNALEAKEMIELGCAFSIDSPKTFQSQFFPLLENPEHSKKLGEQARQFIESQAHASGKCLHLILR